MLNASTAGGFIFEFTVCGICVDSSSCPVFQDMIGYRISRSKQTKLFSPDIRHFNIYVLPKFHTQTFHPNISSHPPKKNIISLFLGPISHQLPQPHTHTHTTLWDLKLHLSIHQVAFQMGSGDWVTLSQWRGTWIHDQILAPWVLTSTEGAKA